MSFSARLAAYNWSQVSIQTAGSHEKRPKSWSSDRVYARFLEPKNLVAGINAVSQDRRREVVLVERIRVEHVTE